MAIPRPNATTKPSAGETTMKTSVSSTPLNTIAFRPPATNAEPTKPPISAWLLEDGSPKYQVIRSHIMAPMSPASITYTVENSGCMIPLPTVAAIAVPNINGPAKFETAAMLTAYNGLNTLVPTTVAIAFAES